MIATKKVTYVSLDGTLEATVAFYDCDGEYPTSHLVCRDKEAGGKVVLQKSACGVRDEYHTLARQFCQLELAPVRPRTFWSSPW